MKSKVWWILLGILALVIGVLTVYLNLVHKEPGFFKLCWKQNGSITFSNHENCVETSQATWDKIPIGGIPVFLAPSLKSDYLPSLRAGMEIWNSEAGCDLFKEVGDPSRALIIVEKDNSPGESVSLTVTELGIISADITLRDLGALNATARYAARLFGHSLGLDYDPQERSLMCPIPLNSLEINYFLPSDHDKKLLKETYCGTYSPKDAGSDKSLLGTFKVSP